MSEYDVIVIGAGYGGAAVGALLAKDAKRVLLVDKNPQAGGKSVTIRKDGYGYEMWPIVGIPGAESRFHELLATLDVEEQAPPLIPTKDPGQLLYKRGDGKWILFAGAAEDPTVMDRLQTEFGVSPEELTGFMTMAAEMIALSEDDVAGLDETCMWDWMAKFDLPKALQSYLGVILNLFFLVPVDRCPASEGIMGLRDFLFSGGGGGRYHRGGFGRVAEVAADYVAAHGGTFLNKTRVERILVEDGRAVGIRTVDGDEHRAPVVISNAGIQPTVLKLAGDEHFPADYVARVASLEPSWGIVGVRYFLDAPIFHVPAILGFSDQSWWDTERYERAEAGQWPDVPALYIVVPNLYDPGLAPDDQHQVVIIGTMSSADPKSPMSMAGIAKVEEAIAAAWPEITDHIVKREVYTTQNVSAQSRDSVVPGQGGECIGLGQFIGQVGRTKPDPRTPLPGLYLVGCDAGGIGMGTHQAVDSAFNVAAMVLTDTTA